ncbi:RING finger protein 145-like isoform X34 [Gopherus flavomarginatus]|uniref:RING finger protein 145-like isoform X31 n=1 Tax=Gopherus flavomarginatus TaxID=286002 RepID=UPI0021CBAF9B|nr:RING finger protein 145-like isoform X31 [Gopherus flavomarginatus]XP_050799291.1 RING finger protein 145-like isoform X32 [Gopherus flavomarginatus]XP_050799293.1 RING finger protein 145-like isoform X34 [Gopherus flavomarginatus]
MAEEASRGACARPSGGLSVVLPAGAGLGESESDTEAAAPRAGNGPPDPPPPLGRDPPRRDPSGGPPAAWPWGPAMPRLEEVANVVLRVPSIVLLDLLYRWDVQAFAELLRPKQEEATWRRHALWHAYYLGHVLCVVVLLLPVRSLVRLYLYGLTLLLLFVGHQTARDYMRHEMEDEFQGAVYQDPVVLRRFVTALTGQIFVSMLCALLMKTKQVWLFCAPLLPLLARLCGLPLQALPVVNTFATSVTVVEVLYVATSHLLVPFHLAAAACREVAQGLEVYRLVALGMSLWSQLAVPVLFLVFWLVLFTLQIYSFLASSNSLLAQQGLLFIFLSSVAECCGTPYSLLGLTFTVSYLALAVLNLCKFYLLGYDAFQNGNVMHRGVTEGVTLLLLALQTGLLDLQILQRTFLLSIILFIVVTSTLQSMIEIADPIVLALGASQNRSPWKHFRSLSLCLFLLVFPCFMAYKIARFFHMDFWLLILVSSCMLTSLQVRPGPLLPPPTPSLALPSLQVRPGPLLPPPTPSLALPSLQVRPGPLLPPPTPSLALPSLQVRPGSLLPPPTPSLALPSLQVRPGSLLPPSTPSLALTSLQVRPGPLLPPPTPSLALPSLQVQPGPPSPLPPPSCTLTSPQVRLGPPSPLPPTSCTLTSLQVRPGLPSPLPPPSCTLTSLQVRPGPFLPVPIPSRSLPSLQVMGTLFVYALFMIELLQDAPLEKTDEIIYYVNAVSRVLEFLVAVCVVAYGTWESIFGEWSWMGASVIIIHSYFNVWLRAQSGWKSFLLRREAAKKINSLPRATRGQLRDHNDVCAICFQEMTVAVITDCGHFFHTGCLRKWLYVQDTCPMCHQPVKPSATEGPQSNGGERAEPEPELVPEEGPPEDADAEAAGRTRTLGPSRAAGGREPSWQEQENPALAEPSRAAEGEEPSWQEQENPALAAPSRAGLLPEAVHSREDEPMDPAGSRTPPPMSRGCAP